MKRPKPGARAPVIHAPRMIAIRYQAELVSMVQDLEAEIRRQLIAALPSLAAERNAMAPRADRWDMRIEEIISALTVFGRSRAERVLSSLGQYADQISGFNRRAFASAMANVLGVDMFRGADGPWLQASLRSWASENARLIQSIPEQMLTQVEGIAQRALRTGADPRETARQIRERFGVTEVRARLIARDQVAKLNSNITEGRNLALGLTTYVWSTSGDERVRESHAAMNGKLCKWDDETVYSDDDGQTWQPRSAIGGVEEHPGRDFQCRCVSAAVIPPEFLGQ
jgi:SPP1 gp7 family putative phage head morphogenesis protein